MGYYTGNGVVTGGGSTVSLRSTGPAVGGAYYSYQRTHSTMTTKNGVSLATAQAEKGEINLNFWEWPGHAIEPACRGTTKSVSYQQINGSNLYSLVITDNVVQFRGKQGNFDSGWVS